MQALGRPVPLVMGFPPSPPHPQQEWGEDHTKNRGRGAEKKGGTPAVAEVASGEAGSLVLDLRQPRLALYPAPGRQHQNLYLLGHQSFEKSRGRGGV